MGLKSLHAALDPGNVVAVLFDYWKLEIAFTAVQYVSGNESVS